MKYTNSIEIALPREKVAQLLADPAQLPKWLRGMVLHEPVNGIHGQLGTKSRVVMQSGKRKIECTETITRRDPADLHEIPKGTVVHFDREIVGAGMWSVVRDRLTEANPETTLWEQESEYRFSSCRCGWWRFSCPAPPTSSHNSTCRTSRRSPNRARTSAKEGTDLPQSAT